ncbi:hypothetical protein JZ751_010790, partial [Albula glossodonta]
VLIASHLPSYELRHNQVESIFLSAIDMYGHQFCIENLQVSASAHIAMPSHKLILSETSIFDVLPNFFYHSNQVVRMAALERGPAGGFGTSSTPDAAAVVWEGGGGGSRNWISDLKVYVRRAYIAYELNSVQHRQLKDNTCIVEFQFMLPSSHPNREEAVIACEGGEPPALARENVARATVRKPGNSWILQLIQDHPAWL